MNRSGSLNLSRSDEVINAFCYARSGSPDRALEPSSLCAIDPIMSDPAVLSQRGRLLADRARHAQGSERQRLFREASAAYAQASAFAADLAGKYAWQVEACGTQGDHDGSTRHPLIEERLLRRLIEKNPQNMELKTAWIALQRILAFADSNAGRGKKAAHRLAHACNAINEMLAFDPCNETWLQQRDRLDLDIAKLAP
jgi:hypothetical protein